MAEKDKSSTGMKIKDQGFVPYSDAQEEKTPNVSKGSSVTGKKRGMGAALRGDRFTIS